MLKPHFQGLRDRPLLGMLLLSLSLHLAVLMIVQPTRVQERHVSPPITARLLEPQPVPALSQPEPDLPALEAPSIPAAMPPSLEPPPLPVEAKPASAAVVPALPKAAVDRQQELDGKPASAVPAVESLPVALPSIPMLFDPTWYTARQLDAQPRPLLPVQPAYPAEAQRAGIEGSLKLMLKVDEAGVVQEAVVEEANPAGVFDQAALAAFSKARFSPAQKNQRPVRAQIYIRVVFRLE